MILFALITLSCISAADNNATAEIIAQDNGINADEIVAQDKNINTEEILTNGETEVSDFSTLNTEITNSTTDTIQLTKNYTYNSEKDTDYTNGIVIDKADFTVDGQGHSIDGSGLARIFQITANNVTLKNINFKNGCNEFGGAISCENGNLTIAGCNFTNNKAISDEGFGGAIGFDADSLTISNSRFIGNTADNGSGDSGAVYFTGKNLNIIQSEFINNSAKGEGAMCAIGDTVTISKSRFKNNKAESGIVHISALNSLINECEFINNSAEVYVGVSNNLGKITINNSYFANNTAERSTRLIRNAMYSTATISNCVFENNTGNEGNYTIDNNYGTIYLHNNTINAQSSEIHNYGGNITSPCTAIALENKTIPVAVGEKTTLTATILDDNGNLIEEAYYVYFKINDESIESTYNPQTSRYEANYTFKTAGSVTIDIICPSINITVEQGTCDVRHHTYVDLIDEINSCQDNTIELTKDYIYDSVNDSSYTNGIVIDRADFIIDGQGHTIDGAELARIFQITANNITLKNINFKNGLCEFRGAITCENGNLTISGCNFTNNKATADEGRGGAIYFNADSLTISNSKFTGNVVSGPVDSGAIYFNGNNLNITQSEFIDNFACNDGVMTAIGNTVTISNSRFENNRAIYGIICITSPNSSIDECKFINNSAEGYVGVSNRQGTMTINNTYFANNTADESTGLIHNSQDNTVIISNCVFENNTGNEGNYSIYNNQGTIYLHNNTINTQASEIYNDGGNINSPCTAIVLENKTIYVIARHETTLTAVIFDDNGNIIEDDKNVYFKINEVSIRSTYNPKTSKYEVKHIFSTVGSVSIDIICASMNLTVKQGICDVGEHFTNLANEINNCQDNTLELTKSYIYDPAEDSGYANGIIIDKANFTIDGQRHGLDGSGLARIFKINAENVTLKNINFINGCSDFGGAINCEGYDLTIINCNFTNNKATEKGGALYVEESFANVVNTTFTQNNAPTGGALYIDVCELNIENSTFAENNAFEGGAIYNEELVSISITNTRFADNKAKYGGAIRNEKGHLTLTNDEFTNNHAKYNGGAIHNSGIIDMSNSTFAENNAEYGGAINNFDWEIIIRNTNFTNNTASYGGAINNENGEIEITNSNFTQNTATYGGAIENRYYLNICESKLENNTATYGGAIDNDRGEAIIEYTQFANNTAERYGGAVYNDNGNTDITGANFMQNTARYGGAISSESGQLKISNTEFTQNTANNYGGAVHVSDGDMTISHAKFTNNTATYGGAVNNDGTATMMHTQFANNSAKYGGAISNGKSLTISLSTLENNTATATSGGIESEGTLIVESTQFMQNSAGDYAGAIGSWGKLYIADSNFTQNSANESPGAIYNLNYDATITNARFINNTADTAGAIETAANLIISNCEFIGNGENCVAATYGAKLTLNNITSDVQLVNDTIIMEILEAKDVVYGNDVNIKVQANSSAIYPLNSGKVVVKVNGVEYTADVKYGIATLVIPKLDAGTYNVNVAYIANDMSRAEIPVKFTVNKKDITINAKNAAYVINYGGTYKVSFKDVADGTKVTFTLNGKNIGTSTIKNGAASIKLTAKILKAAKAGKKNMVIKIGNKNYSPISKTVKITINKEKTKITAKAKTFKRTTKTKKYTITLKNSKGKAVKKAKVTLKVKGKTYTAKTNSKGKATFKITKLTKKGTYKAVIKYKGNGYYNKITKNIKIKIR